MAHNLFVHQNTQFKTLNRWYFVTLNGRRSTLAHTQKRMQEPPTNGEVCHSLVHEDFFIHPHFIPYFVLCNTMTSCSYRGECERKIALFVTENVTINLFECKHMKWACYSCVHIRSYRIAFGIVVFLASPVLVCHYFVRSAEGTWIYGWSHMAAWHTAPTQMKRQYLIKPKRNWNTPILYIFFIFLLWIVVIAVLEMFNARITKAVEWHQNAHDGWKKLHNQTK